MAHFNECSQLIAGADKAEARYAGIVRKVGGDPLQVMLDMQKSLQVRLANDKPGTNMHPDELAQAGDIVQIFYLLP